MSDLSFVSSMGLSALITGLVGVVATIYKHMIAREKSLYSEQINEIAKTVKEEQEGNRIRIVGDAINIVPSGLSTEQFEKMLDRAVDRISVSAPPNNFSQAVENLISDYHTQALSQAKVQFWFSLIVAVVGFVWILVTGIQIRVDQLSTLSKVSPGIVMDAIAFLFFKQATATRQRATELFDRLRTDKQAQESLKLVESIDDLKIRSIVKAQIALHMSGLNPKPIDLYGQTTV
jgi:hypothetical protein